MKEGWKYRKLGEICTILNGFAFKSSKYTTNGIRVIRITNVQNGYVEDKEPKYYPLSYYDELKKYLLSDGDLLMSLTGNVGRVCILTKDFLPAALNQRVACLRLKTDIISLRFLFLYLNSNYFENICIKNSSGAAQLNMSTIWLSEQQIPIPSLEEQQRIVSRLDASFAKIDALSKQAEEALEHAKALFQAKLKELMEKKEGWEEKKLGEICSIESKLVDPTKDEFVDLLHVGGANIVSFTGELVGLKTAKEEKITSGKFYFDDKVVLYNKIRPYLVKVTRPDFDGLCSADMYPLTPSKIVTKDYLYYILITKDFTEYAVKRSARAGMPKVNRECLFAYECYIPSLSEQHQIVQTLDSLSQKIQQLEENTKQVIVNCDALKQSLLRQVFEV